MAPFLVNHQILEQLENQNVHQNFQKLVNLLHQILSDLLKAYHKRYYQLTKKYFNSYSNFFYHCLTTLLMWISANPRNFKKNFTGTGFLVFGILVRFFFEVVALPRGYKKLEDQFLISFSRLPKNPSQWTTYFL